MGEAHGVPADFFQQVTQGDEGAGAFAHAHGLAGAHDVDDLAEQDFERLAVVGEGADGRFHAADIAAMIRTPHVDHDLCAARHLVGMVGDVIGEVGVAAVAFAQGAIDVIAELGGAEKGLRAGFPVLGCFAFGGIEHAFVDQGFGRERVDGGFGGAAGEEGALAEEDVVGDAEQGQVLADAGQQGGDGGSHARCPATRRAGRWWRGGRPGLGRGTRPGPRRSGPGSRRHIAGRPAWRRRTHPA